MLKKQRTTLIAIIVLGFLVYVPNAIMWVRAARIRDTASWESQDQFVTIAFQGAFWTSVAVVLGYTLASPLFRWTEADSFKKQALIFPAIVGVFCLLEMYFGPAGILIYLLSKPFPPAHAGMLSSLVAMFILSFVTAAGLRAVDRLTRSRLSN